MHPKPKDRMAAIEWAREMLAKGFYILDCETTSKYPAEAEIVQIAIIDHEGRTRLDLLLKPTQPIPDDVIAIHGITNEAVVDAPWFLDAWSLICDVIHARELVVYNAGYDIPVIKHTLGRLELEDPYTYDITAHCAMLQYAQFIGEPGRYGGYKWQRLPIAPGETAHGAASDCRSTLHLIRMMAEAEA